MSENATLSTPRDQYGRTLQIPACGVTFLDGSGLASPATTNASGELTLTVPVGASRLRVSCAAKALRLGLSDSDLAEATAGAYIEFAAATWFTIYCVNLSTILLRVAEGSQQTIQYVFDTLSEEN